MSMINEMLSTDGFPLLIPLCIFYPQFLYRWPHGKWQLIWWNVLHIRTFMQAVFCDMCNKVLLRYLILFFKLLSVANVTCVDVVILRMFWCLQCLANVWQFKRWCSRDWIATVATQPCTLLIYRGSSYSSMYQSYVCIYSSSQNY